MKILYVGPDTGTCRQRRLALERLGHEPFVVDPFAAFPDGPWVPAWLVRTGGLGLSPFVERHVLSRIGGRAFDLALVDGGELVGPALVRALRKRAPRIVHFNLDNPFTPRDRRRWRLMLQALPEYDVFMTPRRSSAETALRLGAPSALQFCQAADELVDRPRAPTAEERLRFGSEVAFIGAWMPERGPFLLELIQAGVPLRIFGPRWSKAPEYEALKPHVVIDGLLDGDAFASAIRSTKIALGLLSKGNEDLHTTRSLQIPALGTLFCAERTSDHLAMYRDGEEAVFWDDAKDCAAKCLALLAEPERIAAIAVAGQRRMRERGWFNEPLMAGVVSMALQPDAPRGVVLAHQTLAAATVDAAPAGRSRRA